MDAQRIVGRFGRRLLWCTLGSMFALGPGMASAQDACANASNQFPHDCQNQVQAGVSYNGLQSQNWAYYRTGDHPHFFERDNAYDLFGNTCFTAVEHDSENDNFDAGFTNWCTGTQTLVVVLACLSFNPNK